MVNKMTNELIKNNFFTNYMEIKKEEDINSIYEIEKIQKELNKKLGEIK